MKTTGELRQALASLLEKVVKREINIDYANTAIKAAAQINESFYAEIKVKAIEKQLGGVVHKLGKMNLNEDEA